MRPNTFSQTELIKAADYIVNARKLVAITGAGISTASGIPDFRSAEIGLWEKQENLDFVSLTHFRRDPLPFFRWVGTLASMILKAEPNAAHLVLAKWEMQGLLQCIVTQNIDMLHEEAGSRTVYEVHGHLRTCTCTHCMRSQPGRPILEQLVKSADAPLCPHCGWVLKPDVILFGEQLPHKAVQAAENAAKSCDVLLVVGSSLEVYPAAHWPLLAQQNNAKLILVNRTPTYLDAHADCVFHGNCEEVLPQLDGLLRTRLPAPASPR